MDQMEYSDVQDYVAVKLAQRKSKKTVNTVSAKEVAIATASEARRKYLAGSLPTCVVGII